MTATTISTSSTSKIRPTAALLLFVLTALSISFANQAQAQSRGGPRLTGIPTLNLSRVSAATAAAYPLPDDEWRGDDGSTTPGNPDRDRLDTEPSRQGRDRARITYPQIWDLRAGYSMSGAFGLGQSPNTLEHGGEIGFRLMLDQVTTQWANARVQVAAGEAGLNYLSVDASIFKIRLPLDRTEALWLGFAPIEIDARVTTSDTTRGRFGWSPRVQIGTIFRVGGQPHDESQPCAGRTGDSARTGVCDPRRYGTADGACVLQLFASVGAMIGHNQTQNPNEVGQILTGLDFLAVCRTLVVDLSYAHLFSVNRADVDRVDADIFMRFPVNRFDVGPYITTQVNHEFGSNAVPVGDPARDNRVFMDFSSGLRMWW